MKEIAVILALVVVFQTGAFAGPGPKQKTIAVSPVFKVSGFQKNMLDNAPGARKKRIGSTMVVFGSVLLVAGTAMVSTADSYSYNYSNTNGNVQESGDPKGAFGVLFMAAGVGLIIPGAIIWSKGLKSDKAYKESISFNFRGTSAGLAYRF